MPSISRLFVNFDKFPGEIKNHITNLQNTNHMRRIEFLAPVEAMRGNLSGGQKLTYPTQNNSAWDAPSDKRSYATNYNTRYIGSKRSSDGLKFFSVRTKSAVTMSPAMREGMALLSMSRIFAVNCKSDLNNLSQLQQLFIDNHREGQTFTAWLQENIRRDLKLKANAITFGAGTSSRIIYANPFAITIPDGANCILPTNGTKLDEQARKVFKFWNPLGPNNAATIPVNMPDGSTAYMLVKTDASFVTNFGGDIPEGFGLVPNIALWTSSLTRYPSAIDVSGAPDNTKVRIIEGAGSLTLLELYRRPEGEPASADVLVDSVIDSPETGYIYTFKRP